MGLSCFLTTDASMLDSIKWCPARTPLELCSVPSVPLPDVYYIVYTSTVYSIYLLL